MGLQFSQPGAAEAVLENKAVFVLPDPHADASNPVRRRLRQAVSALLDAQRKAGDAEGSVDEAEALVKTFADAFGGRDAQS